MQDWLKITLTMLVIIPTILIVVYSEKSLILFVIVIVTFAALWISHALRTGVKLLTDQLEE